jgi:hypothetical protein
MFKKIKQKYINQGIDIGYDSGRKSGLAEGEQIGIQKGFNSGLVFAQEYYEGKAHDEHIKQEVDKVESESKTVKPTEARNTLLSLFPEILDTKYFKTYLFSATPTKDIKTMVDYIDYLEHKVEIKIQYPNTYPHLSEIKKAIDSVYQNRLIIDEAEKVIK